jgi:YbbR domain-containing protein
MRLRDLFFSNLLPKVFSLLFAVLLWGIVIGEKHAQIQMNVPLDLVNIPEKAVVVSDVPSSLSVQFQGPRTLLRTLQGRDIRRRIDLKGMGVGWTTIRILPDSVPVPRGVEVVRVTPATLDLRLEPLKEVRLPVTAQVVGDPPKGYRVEGIAVEPARVVLKGGESELTGLGGVKTRQVNIAQATTDMEERVGLELEGLHLVEVSPNKVWVRVKLSPIVGEKAVEGVAVQMAESGGKASVHPERVRVHVKGPIEILDGVKEMDIQAKVNGQGLGSGSHTVTPSILVPQGIQVVGVEPPTVEVKVEGPETREQ